MATALIEVAPTTTEIGYIVRKLKERLVRLVNLMESTVDRFIQINQQDPVTKVHITQGEKDVHIVPTIPSPEIDDGVATFYYRDRDLYIADQMDRIEKVELGVSR